MKLHKTPDGISAEDWNKVHELSLAVVNASEERTEKKQLLAYLDTLEKRYGSLPSILATKADLIDDPHKRLGLYQRAYEAALENSDKLNLALITLSIAEIHVEELEDRKQSEHWLAIFKENIKDHPDEYLKDEYKRLFAMLNEQK